MKRRPPDPQEATSEGSDPDKPLGYGNPPRRTQFKPGKSGNPRGRPKKEVDVAAGFRDLFRLAMSRKHRVKDGEKTRLATSAELGIDQMFRRFAQGDAKARRDVLLFAASLGLNLAPAAAEADGSPIKPDHAAILRNFLDRAQQEPQGETERVIAPPGFLEDFSDEK